MSQTINLLNTETQSDTYTPEQFDYSDTDTTPALSMTETVATDNTLDLMYNGKALFSIKKTAFLLSVSYEFVRSRVASQAIPSVGMGNRKMISLDTLIHIKNNGVK